MCSPQQPLVTDVERSIVRICDSLLRDFYGNNNLNEPTDAFESCGAWNSPTTYLLPDNINARDTTKYVMSSDNAKLIFPKSEYQNAGQFYEDFISIPFMPGF